MSQSSAHPHQGRPRPDSQTIQHYLDENVQLIQAIVENQNKGKAMGCLQYQQMLHRNLMYLAGLVDPNLQNMLPPPMNFHQMGNQSSHMSPKLPGRQPNPSAVQVSGWSSSMPSQYDSTKTSYNQFSQSFPVQNSNPIQHQLDAEKRRQLLRIRQDQLIQAQQQHARGISEAQLRSAAQFSSLPSHLQQQPPPPYTTHSSVSAPSVNESSSQNNN